MSNTPTFRNLQISPQNVSPNGVVSIRQGMPVISFIISEQAALLRGRTVVINGNIQHTKDGTAAITATDQLNTTMRNGVLGFIDQIVITSIKGRQVIEHLHHVSRFVSAHKSYNSSLNDAIGFQSQTEHTNPNYFLNKICNVDNKVVVSTDNNQNSNSFSLHLPSGFLSSSSIINLDSQTGIGGIQIDIHLNSDAQFYNCINQSSSLDLSSGANDVTNAQYKLTQLKLTCEVNPLTPEDIQQMSKNPNKTLNYQNFAGHYKTINSTNAILNFQLGASRVKAISCSFIRDGDLNNLTRDGNAITMPLNSDGSLANIRSIVFLKNGERYPLNYVQDTNYKNDKTINKLDSANIKNSFGSFITDSERIFYESTQITSNNSNRKGYNGGVSMNQQTDGGVIYTVGCNYDYVGGGSSNFSGSNLFGLQMDLDLTSNQPNAVFVFVHKESTLVYNAQGLTVQD